jgi:phosphate-selective porin OprO/OprP
VHRRTRIALALAVGGLGLAAAWPAAGQGTAMRQLVEVLHADGTISPAAYEALQAALAADEAAFAAREETLAREVEQAASEAATTATAELEHRVEREDYRPAVKRGRRSFTLVDEEEGFDLMIGGRIHADSVWYMEDRVQLSSSAELRRARIDLRGTVWHDWTFSAGFDFASGSVGLRGMSLTYRGFEPVRIQTGRLREPFGMDELTSSNYTTFLERDPVSDNLVPGRNIGVAVSANTDHWSTKAGVFWSNTSEGGDSDGEIELDGSWALTARQTWAPVNDERRVLHFGLAGSYRSGGDLGEARFRARWGTHVTDVRFLDTGTVDDIHRGMLYGAELAGVLGPFSFQSEYIGARFQRDGLATLDFEGYYAQASWFLTGESRSYYASRGVFGRVTPRSRFDLASRAPGAWELAVRYSTFDLNSEEILGGEQNLVTLGLNWYPNANVRFMLNYVKVLDVDRPGHGFDDDQPAAVGVRSQIHF